MSKKAFLKIAFASLLSLGVFSGAFASYKNSVEKPLEAASVTYTNGDGATYYNGISDTLAGDSLLSALRALNKDRRKSTVGYKAMGTTPNGQFKYTDYDPNTVKYDSNGQPYGTKLISFYSGNSAVSGMNREHVWPDSHGGNKVEADIHMPRPTIESENGSRGNSFYVEGMKDGKYGWDPAMESFGVESYRGDSARIIFYCVVADSNLSLVDLEYHSTSKSNNDNLMGKLSDMLKWNLNYPVQQREKNRNEGAEYLQGNRNPFIDHPEYACKIWGNYNDATKAICQGHMGYDTPYLKTAGSFNKTTYKTGESLDPTGMTIIYNAGGDNDPDIDVTSSVTWEPATFIKPGQIEVLAKYQDLVISCGLVTVKDAITLEITGELEKTSYYVGETFDPKGLSVIYTKDDVPEDVTDKATWNLGELKYEGNYKVTASYNGISASYGTYINVSIEPVDHDESLELSGSLKKTKYKVGDWIEPDGVTIWYTSDIDVEDVTNDVEFDPMQFNVEGQINVFAYYKSKYGTNLSIFIGTVTVGNGGEQSSSSSSEEQYSESETGQSEQTSTESSASSSSSEEGKKGGGCSASIGGSSSIVFLSGFAILFFAIRKLIRIKKEDK